MTISTEAIKTLRERTGAGILDCKKALEQAQGNMDRAAEILRQQGFNIATKRAERATQEGLIATYVHGGGRIGAMVEVNCETDFVARTSEFKDLAHNLAMQVAAMNPRYLSKDQIPNGVEASPTEVCLLQQPFIKDLSKSVQDLVVEVIAKTGENIRVRRFTRFSLGD